MLREQRMGMFGYAIMTESERDDIIEDCLYESECELFDLENGYYMEAEESAISNIIEKIKTVIKTMIDKIKSVFKKKAVEEVDMSEEVEVDKEEYSKIQKILNSIKKFLSYPIEKFANMSNASKLFLFIGAGGTALTVGALVISTRAENKEIRTRNTMRVVKTEAMKILNESESQLTHMNGFISKLESKAAEDKKFAKTMKKTGEIEKQKAQMANLANKASTANYVVNSISKGMKDKGFLSMDIEAEKTVMQNALMYARVALTALNSIIKQVTILIFKTTYNTVHAVRDAKNAVVNKVTSGKKSKK